MQKNNNIFATVKLAAIIAYLNSIAIADIQIIDLFKKVFEILRSILDFALFRLLIQQIVESKKFFANLKESIAA